jgi:hypothetical protein
MMQDETVASLNYCQDMTAHTATLFRRSDDSVSRVEVLIGGSFSRSLAEGTAAGFGLPGDSPAGEFKNL